MTEGAVQTSTEDLAGRFLAEQVVLVTGGSRGIGRALVEVLSHAGASVCFTYARQQAAAEAVAAQLASEGASVMTVQADVRDLARAQGVVAQTLERFGRLDALVNNAGIVRDKALMFMGPEEWEEVLQTNLTGVFNYCRAAIVTLLKQRSGRIVNIASVAGLAGMARQVNYAASKAGIIGFTRALARETASHGVLVNAVAPGYIETEMTAAMDEARRTAARAQIPLGRFGTPAEVAQIVALLLHPCNTYLTGQVVTVDGGLVL